MTRLHAGAGEEDILWGAQVPGMPDKVGKAPPVDEDNPMGGQMYRKLMERAKEGPSRPKGAGMNAPEQQPQPQYQQPPPITPPPPQPQYQQPPQPQAMDPYSAYQAQLQAWQQQMTAFAQFSASNPEAAAQMTMPAPPQPPQMQGAPVTTQQQPQPQPQVPPPPQPVSQTPNENSDKPKSAYDYLPQGDGRNNQAYEVNNAADVYFAQLKRDSRVRIDARKRGDLDAANKPFEEEGVKALKGLLSDELIASRREQLKQSGGEFETSRDEMLMPEHFASGEEEVDKTYTGVSYKERLMQAKRNKKSGGASTPPPPPPATATVETPATNPPSEFVPKVEPITFVSPATDETPSTPSPSAERTETSDTSTETPETKQPNFALAVKDESEIEAIAAPSMEDSEENRKSIRTLMGLLLKHRGGPGFGHGRLKEEEAKKLENEAAEVMALLNQESGGGTSLSTATTDESASSADAAASPLTGTVACVEAVLDMYKKSDETGKDELIMPLRDAMLSAVNTLNKVIAEDELKQQQQPEPVYATTMDFPDEYKSQAPEPEPVSATSLGNEWTYPVPEQTKEKEMEDIQEIADVIAAANSSDKQALDENRKRLQNAYDTLKAVTGSEKFGLKNVNAEEVSKNRKFLFDIYTTQIISISFDFVIYLITTFWFRFCRSAMPVRF